VSVETLKTFENESDSKALAEKLKQIVEKLQKCPKSRLLGSLEQTQS